VSSAFTVQAVTDDDDDGDSLTAKPTKRVSAGPAGSRRIVPIPPPPQQPGKLEPPQEPLLSVSTNSSAKAPTTTSVDYASQLDELLNVSPSITESAGSNPSGSLTELTPAASVASAVGSDDFDSFLASFDGSAKNVKP